MNPTIDLDTLRESVFFRDVEDEILVDIVPHCEVLPLAAGETLFEQDSASNALYFLEVGQIQVLRRYPDGNELVIATESPPYVIGEISMMANLPRSGRVVAVETCRLIKLGRDEILEVCARIPEMTVQTLTNLGQRLYRLNLRVRENAVSNVAARIASLLLLLTDNQAAKIDGNLSPDDIARATAVNSEVVDRLLKQWSEYEIISHDGQQITINHPEALRNLIG